MIYIKLFTRSTININHLVFGTSYIQKLSIPANYAGKRWQTGMCLGDNKGKSSNWIKPTGFDTGVKIYNSFTNKKEPFILPNGSIATW